MGKLAIYVARHSFVEAIIIFEVQTNEIMIGIVDSLLPNMSNNSYAIFSMIEEVACRGLNYLVKPVLEKPRFK